ncbi:3D-(3,5/4)-trihydroxycyclohexane-1,2-dione acylhydrolase (decyclizing) [Faecalicoccus pleomorphus]|uniref:3D-(3,5/4)-trihydroxycyclohexane-1,2-dione acylhydrolase (Decyclizing) n=1 Tax=Faecalicoccus pleomorphus TaxID=1323 RepID=A0AAW6CY06_9FIRM|nr:3D-(3,5/4)-trihydroxycyclohexane-1,2-dione acylhydrolase (decyclizing) [Faecalicoccus pleomorphus]MDB7980251.1 3D-(3,5/4)-trihydroxycyclohexane-1,2-dione acylhydrolase (decyclizing) [Faecalicoccus pleomorphus]MDB7982585.1 3D-(3,5/4)-trihydroxycyclohexane-1,2-dione acylhydrolase (decyclizing) [Faecalicoccus pleomorphus]
MPRLTVAQAIVKFLDNQYVELDGIQYKYVERFFTIFGHGIAVGLGEALSRSNHSIKVMQGRNEQGMCHVAIGYAKQKNRLGIIPCASSIGPGAANMVTAAATATVNHIPLLLFPADTFASRQPDPVLQQLECPQDLSITTNDAFKPVCRYWDRISRPEQLMTAMIHAMRVLTDPRDTGAVCISLPQDCEGEVYDYPEYFFQKRIHRITRQAAVQEELQDVINAILKSKYPLVIVGGGVRYSFAGKAVEDFCQSFKIPFGETQAGKSTCHSNHKYCLGGIGVTGTSAANQLAQKSDCIIALGTRLSDFTTSSKWLFQNPDVQIVNININRFDAVKMDAKYAIGDIKVVVEQLSEALKEKNYQSMYDFEIERAKKEWEIEVQKLKNYNYNAYFEPLIKDRDPRTIHEFVQLTKGVLTQTSAILKVRDEIDSDAVLITAGGSLPSCLQRLWTTDARDSYHAEYGYSCMGYESAAVLGAKLASPSKEVYTLVGDGSFQMLHSEIATAVQEQVKVNILVFDNCGFGCINNLEMTHGIDSIATEFRYRNGQQLSGDLIPVDYAKIGEAFGFKTYTVHNLDELELALRDAKKQKSSVLMDLKVLPKTMTDGYDAWWNVGLAQYSEKREVVECWENDVKKGREQARKY